MIWTFEGTVAALPFLRNEPDGGRETETEARLLSVEAEVEELDRSRSRLLVRNRSDIVAQSGRH